jgi:hypothetical protein
MRGMRFDRLWLAGAALILQGMKKAQYRTPTIEELYALETGARHERARYITALLRSAYERVRSAVTAKVVRHA